MMLRTFSGDKEAMAEAFPMKETIPFCQTYEDRPFLSSTLFSPAVIVVLSFVRILTEDGFRAFCSSFLQVGDFLIILFELGP